MMENRSKRVLKENDNKHRSRLVTALQKLSTLDDNLKPDGVWGSTATIKSGGVTIKSSELDFEFNIPFDDDLESNEGEITVYNLSDNTIKQLKNDETITIEAGYEGDTGVVFNGKITKVLTKRENVDKVTTIKIIENSQASVSVSKSFAAGTTAKYILKTLLGLTKLSIGNFTVDKDYTYQSGVTVDGTLENAISKYSEICGAKTFISNGVIYCYRPSDIEEPRFIVSEETGMIGSPSPYEETSDGETIEGLEIEMLLQHRMFANAAITLKSDMYNGTYKVKSGTHSFGASDSVTKIKVV